MKHNGILVVGIVILFLGAGFITVSGTTNEEQPMSTPRDSTFNVTAGQPTQNGKWIIHVTYSGSTPSAPYTGTYTYSIPTTPGMTPAQKAEKMKEEMNKNKNDPISATSSGANVKVTGSPGTIVKWSSSSTDGQIIHGTNPKLMAVSFMGNPTTGSVAVDVNGLIATTPTNGKTLVQIHNDLTAMLLGMGIPIMIDPSGLALYILVPFPNMGFDSDDDSLGAYGVFYDDPSIEPFGVYVGMPDTFAGNSGSSVTVEFNICNFIFVPNAYHVTATDLLGWNIDPDDFMTDLMPGENKTYTFDVDIPPAKSATMDLMNVTATAINMPWVTGSGLAEIYVNNPPDIPAIDGPAKGKPGTEYTYDICASDPDGDNIYYCINWGDGTAEVCIGPYPSGTCATAKHTWTKKGTYTVKAKARDIYDAESDWGTLSVSIPRTYNPFILRLLERFPNMFPILRHLMGL